MPKGRSLSRRLKGLFFRRLWSQLALALVFFTAVPLAVLGFFLIHAGHEAVRTSVLRDHGEITARSASQMAGIVERPADLLRSAASIQGTLDKDAWKHETVLVELALAHDMFGRLASMDTRGREMASSDPGAELRNRSSDRAFRAALEGGFYMSDLYFSADHMPYVTMAVPIRRWGGVAGVLMAEVNLRGLWATVDDLRIGHTGRAFVFDGKGALIAHEDKKEVLGRRDVSNHPAVEAFRREGGAGFLEKDISGSGLKIFSFAPIAGTPWGLVFEEAGAEAYAYARLMRRGGLGLVAFGMVLTVAVSIFLAERWIRPVRVLADQTRRVARGDLNQHIRANRSDELGWLMRSFNRMTAKLREARESQRLAMIGRASTAIAHELKNSLTMANTLIALLPHRRHDKAFMDDFCRIVPRELEAWKAMLRDLSDYSRRPDFETHPIHVGDLAADFLALIEARARQGRIALLADVPENLPRVMAHPGKLKQVWMNLATNAFEAMPGGGRLTFRIRASEDSVETLIADTGRGIPANKMKKIFDPFFTTKTNGLGIGLSISREIISRLGGSIDIQNREGGGVAVRLILPAWSPPPAGARPRVREYLDRERES